jgi:hypothetical protein
MKGMSDFIYIMTRRPTGAILVQTIIHGCNTNSAKNRIFLLVYYTLIS